MTTKGDDTGGTVEWVRLLWRRIRDYEPNPEVGYRGHSPDEGD